MLLFTVSHVSTWDVLGMILLALIGAGVDDARK